MHTDEIRFVNAFQAKYVPNDEVTKRKGHQNFWVEKCKFLSKKRSVMEKFGSQNFSVTIFGPPNPRPSLRPF